MTRKRSFAIDLQEPMSGASEAALTQFERETGAKIPPDYRSFLTCQNGGVPRKRNFTFGEVYQDSVLRTFFGIDCPLSLDLRFVLDKYAGRIPTNTFPIADDEFDNLIVISRKRGTTNQILFWDHEKELQGSTLTYIAANLHQFLQMLEEDEVIEYNMATITFDDGETVRRVLPFKLNSIDRNAAVDVSDARIGERINDFGETRTITRIEYSREKGISS